MGKFMIRKTATGYKFDLYAANGQMIATSEVYATEAACQKGIRSVGLCAGAGIADLTQDAPLPANPRFELYLDKSGNYRFRLKARNGKVIATSQAYSARAACLNGIDSVRENAAASQTPR